MTPKELYLMDLVTLLKEKALASKKILDTASPDTKAEAIGRLMAFYDVIDLMRQQARAFGIEHKELGLDDIVPERDLL